MSKFNQVIILFVVLCHVHLGHSDTSLESSYNFPRQMQRIGSLISTTQELKNATNDLDISSILNEFKNLPTGKLGQILITALKQMNDSKCQHDIEYLYKSLQSKDMWTIKMLDAFGKPDSGILEGNFKWLGNFHECTHIYVPINENATAGNFNGQYCALDLGVALFNKVVPLTVGICLPDSCENEVMQLKDMFPLVNPMKSLVNVTKLTCQPTSRKLSSAAVGMIVFLSFFILLVVIGSTVTAYEYFSKSNTLPISPSNVNEKGDGHINGDLEKQDHGSCSDVSLITDRDQTNDFYSKVKPFFNCFCIFTNGEKLLNTDSTEGQLLCLHGIRFLSMSWVIVCHTYAFCFTAIGNLVETISDIDSWLFQIILNGFYSVDSFFLLSGFLVAYLFFQESAKSNGKFPWVYFYIHRYLRLTPVYMICLGLNTALYYYMGSGPIWTTNEVEPICRDNWWYNLLYINNFVSQDKQCIAWSWYLANDMQFFIISPLFLITLFRWPTIGYSILGLFMSATFAANFGITYHYDLFSGLGNISTSTSDINVFMARFSEFFVKLYIKPYNRISPYLVGIALAYYLFKRKQNNKGKVNFITLCGGWIVAAAVTLTCLFCLYNTTFTTIENGFYNALNRTFFAGGLGWVIFTCLSGQGGPVNSILSFKLFIPLSRLTYCAYLIHPIFLNGYFGSLKVPLHFSHMTIVTTFLGLMLITYSAAFLVSVLFESPIIRLEKLIRTQFRK